MLLDKIWAENPRDVQGLIRDIQGLVSLCRTGVRCDAPQLVPAPDPTSLSEIVNNGIMTIDIKGHIMKQIPWYMAFLGVSATSTEEVRAAIKEGLASSDVDKIVLNIDSPGGTIDGVQALADEIYKARSDKPIYAYAGDLAASAAYWIGSQATEFSAGPGARIGSIGVYTVVEDSSRLFENEGISVKVVSSTSLKGAFTEGAEIEGEAIDELQREINQLADLFIGSVSRGRGLTVADVSNLASGKVWLAQEAMQLKLINSIESDDRLMEKLTTTDDAVGASSATEDNVDEESKMEKEALDKKLEDEIKARKLAEAKAEAAMSALEEINRKARCAIIEKALADGRITPAMRESQEKLGEQYGSDTAKFEAELAKYPVITRPEPIGQAATDGHASSALDPEEAKAMKVFGLDEATIRATRGFKGITADGQLVNEEVAS